MIGILSSIVTILSNQISSADKGSIIAFIFIKVIVITVFSGMYFYLRKLINHLYKSKSDGNDLILKSNWSL